MRGVQKGDMKSSMKTHFKEEEEEKDKDKESDNDVSFPSSTKSYQAEDNGAPTQESTGKTAYPSNDDGVEHEHNSNPSSDDELVMPLFRAGPSKEKSNVPNRWYKQPFNKTSSNNTYPSPLKSTSKLVASPSTQKTPTTPNPPSPRMLSNTNLIGSELSSSVANTKDFYSRRWSPNPYSARQSAPSLQDLHVQDQLRRFSIADLASIVLQANSIHGSDTKEGSSSQSNDWRIFQIYKKIASHRQENSSITSYFTKLKALWDELATFNTNYLAQCAYGGAIEKLSEHMEREKVMQFLVGLNDSYSTICNQILLTNPFPTVEKAYSSIIHEEKRREHLVAILQTAADKLIQNNLLEDPQNAHSNNVDNNELPH